jgi:hypothetical protein
MFATARDPLLAHGLIERAGIAHNLLDIFSVAPAAQRVFGVIIEGNVEHGTKIQIEPEKAQQSSGDIAVAPDQIDIVFIAQLLRVRRFASDAPQSRDAPAFLIDCNNGLDVAQVAQIVDELSELRRALEVASEENECSRLHAPKQAGCFRIEFFPGNTRHDQLTKPVSVHWRQASIFIGKYSMINSQRTRAHAQHSTTILSC